MRVDSVVVGAGFAGCVMAERLAEGLGHKVLLVEKRNHLGGNCHDGLDDHGVLVQTYGPHIFHTPSEEVWRYTSRFTDWRLYQHHVVGFIDGRIVPIPFNLNSIDALLPRSLARALEHKLVERFGFGRKVPILDLRSTEDPDLRFLADLVYEKVFKRYTQKHWDARLEDLDEVARSRVPVFISRDDRYFQDPYQGIPAHGFHRLFERMVDHPNIRVLLQADWKDVAHEIRYKRLIYTGPIDTFFDNAFGVLRYRTLDLKFQHHPVEQYQVNAVVNYPNDYAFTRITEYKHFTGQKCQGTTVSTEVPGWCRPGVDIPYYPMPDAQDQAVYRRYQEAARQHPEVVFLGRLAEYRYYDMDDIVEAALRRFEALAREEAP